MSRPDVSAGLPVPSSKVVSQVSFDFIGAMADFDSDIEADAFASDYLDDMDLGAEAGAEAEEEPETVQPALKTKAKGKAKGKAGKKLAEGYAVCKLCGKKIPLDEMPENSANCAEDKSYLEALWRLARKQGQMDWNKRIRLDDKELKKSIIALGKANPMWKTGGRKAALIYS